MPTTEVTSSAVNAQPYQARPSSSATAVGSAVATAIASKAIRLIETDDPGRRRPVRPGQDAVARPPDGTAPRRAVSPCAW